MTPSSKSDTTSFAADGLVRCALESIPDGVLILNLAGTVQFVNSSAVRLHGLRAETQMLGENWLTLWAEPDRAAAQAALSAAAHGESRPFPALVHSADAALRRLNNTVSPLRRDAAAPVAQLLVTCTDNTDLEDARLDAESRAAAAAEEAALLRSVAEMAYLGGWEIDFRRNVAVLSDAGVQSLHGDPENREISLERALDMFSPEDQARFRDQIECARLRGGQIRFDAQVMRHDGTRSWVRAYGQPVYEDGVCVGIRGAGMDISDAMTAQESIQSAQQRLNLAVRLAGMEVYELDFEGQTLIQEGSSVSIFDKPLRYENLWPDPLSLVDQRDRARIRAEWTHALEIQAPFRSEFRIHRRDGREIWIYGVAEVVRKAGRPHRLVGAIMDITQRKRGELEILRTMAQMREHEARQKLLLDELNHRVKNTLAAVQSVAAQTLTDERDSHEAREIFTERLLALSATHNLLVKHAWENASFQELVETALKPYGQAYGYEGPDLRLDPNFSVSLGMALHELATNALKHGAWREGGEVHIATVEDCGQVRITWRESGGPPVSAPARRGFGSRLLQRGVAAELGGKVVLDFAPDGLVCRIEAPLSARLRVCRPAGIRLAAC